MKKAILYKKLKGNLVQCELCPHYCVIKQDNFGRCGVRQNIDGELYSLVYGKAISLAIDPIEKKPLYHFMPNTMTFSIAAAGCNMTCEFCQNWRISQAPKIDREKTFGQDVTPEEVVRQALENKCPSISYTYTEPTIFLEYALDIAKLACEHKLKNIFVTNGFITPRAIDLIVPWLHAANIDLKGFSEEFYKQFCGARLQPVLEAIKYYYEHGIHLEITTLVIPGKNDSETELNGIAEFIAGIDKEIPWHISRFFPAYKMQNLTPTHLDSIKNAEKIGQQHGLKHIYLGNIW